MAKNYSESWILNPNHAKCVPKIGFDRLQVWTLGPIQEVPSFGTSEGSGRALNISLEQLSSTTPSKFN